MQPKNNKIIKFIIAGVLLLAVATFVKLDYDKAMYDSNENSDERVIVEVEEGESVNNILESLLEKGFLNNRSLYYAKFYLRINNLGQKLQAGVYELPKNLSIKELIDAMQFGRSQDVWVSIPEGLRKDEIAQIVENELVKSGSSTFSKEEFLSLALNKDFINSLELSVDISDLEGFLFPDKYAFPKDANAQLVITKLVDNFKIKVGTNYTYEDIILASIVEREGFNEDDRPIIAGIIVKRYNEGWLLQTDATLLYPVKDWKHTITIQDKQDDNLYNTYKRIGLPPTPICNPGLQSVQAVWNPTETKYYYYIHDKDKNPHYATTLDEHNINVNKYLR